MDDAPDQPEAVVAALRQQGMAILRGLLRPQVEPLRAVVRAHQEAGLPMSEQILYTNQPPRHAAAPPGMRRIMDQWLNPHRRQPPLSTREIAVTLAARVASWLGEPAALFQDVLMNKREGHAAFPWHQDFPFWPVDRPAGVIVWAPLDPVDAAGGGLRLAPGSHLLGIGPAIDLHTGEAQPGYDETTAVPAAGSAACPALAPGDVVVFHPLTWHSSPVNRSGRQRWVWASTWLAGSVRWSVARAPRHPLCRLIKDGAPVLPGGAP